MMLPIFRSDMPSTVSPSTPAVMAPLLEYSRPWASRYNCGLNNCRYNSSHGRPRLPRSRRTPSTVSALCISHTSQTEMSDHLCPFALWTALPSSLAGRDPCDYYGHSVTLELSSRRRSHVHLRRT